MDSPLIPNLKLWLARLHFSHSLVDCINFWSCYVALSHGRSKCDGAVVGVTLFHAFWTVLSTLGAFLVLRVYRHIWRILLAGGYNEGNCLFSHISFINVSLHNSSISMLLRSYNKAADRAVTSHHCYQWTFYFVHLPSRAFPLRISADSRGDSGSLHNPLTTRRITFRPSGWKSLQFFFCITFEFWFSLLLRYVAVHVVM